MLKRLLSLGLISTLLAGLVPFGALANHPDANSATVGVNLNGTTRSFDPTSQQAFINFNVHGTARGLTVDIYRAVPNGNRTCNDLVANKIATVFSQASTPTGNYTATWSGRNLAGGILPVGAYCYQINWNNHARGDNTLVEGLITLNEAGNRGAEVVAGGQAGGAGGQPGGQPAGGQAGGQAGGAQPAGGAGAFVCGQAGAIVASVDPGVINPRAQEGNSAYISFCVNQNLANGYSLKVYDSGNFVVKDLFSTNQLTVAGTRSVTPWNGRRNDGSVVNPGDYFFKFRVDGRDVTTGLIRVESPAAVPPGGVQPDLVHWVHPGLVDPTAVPAQSFSISYTLNRRMFGLSVAIRDVNNNPVRQLYSTNNTIEVGTYPNFVTWNGRFADSRIVPVGAYRYVFFSGGREIGSGQIHVQYSVVAPSPPPPPPPALAFILSHGANPQRFIPSAGQVATITYTLGKTVNNFRLSVRNQQGAEVAVLATASSKAAGTHSNVWNGASVNPGQYSYVFEASFESSVSGPVYVDPAAVVDAPVIVDLGPSLGSFYPRSNNVALRETAIRYQLTQDARVDVTIIQNNVTIRRLLASNVSNNRLARNVYSEVWDGRDSNGNIVNPGLYTYFIEARNNNGIATPVSRTVTVLEPEGDPIAPLDVSNVFAEPNPFVPANNQNTAIKFTINHNANVTITITRGDNSYVKTLVSNKAFSAGSNQEPWNGTDQYNNRVIPGAYNVRVEGVSMLNATTDSMNTTVTVDNTPQQNQMDVSNVFANPRSFTADTQNTFFTYTINQNAGVTIVVTRTDGTFIRTITSNQFTYAGTNLTALWDGRDQNGSLVAEGDYNFRVDAVSAQYGSDYGASLVTVNRVGVNPPPPPQNFVITDLGANPNPFNPRNGQITKIDFRTSVTPSSVNVKVYRTSTNAFIRELPVYALAGSNSYRAEWDGRSSSNRKIVIDDTYTYRITATNGGVSSEVSGLVYVRGGVVVVPDDKGGDCGNFTDVPKNSSLCPAIRFVVSRGIFVGYKDGSNALGIDNVIQRAELAAAAQKAFRFSLDPYSADADGSLGYKDLKKSTDEWYMPYLKTFSRLGLMVGYPDGRMRPERTMNTAELYLVFLKSAKAAPGKITHYSLANHEYKKFPPFLDTPLTEDTKWYILYAAFAKLNDLVKTERFYPSRGITRGQVIQLVYDTHRKGLITYGPPLVAGSY